jgi:FMN phosphatase YigB (HAD superfamily)
MVGDSLSSDVAGAQAVGMPAVHLSDERTTGDVSESSVVPDHRIESLAEMLELLRGRDRDC